MKSWFKEPLFLLGLFLKLACLGFFGSAFLKELFIPFLDTAVLHPLSNPWSLSPPHFFPYGSFLYLLLFIPRYFAYLIVGSKALGVGFLGLALVKFPLLVLDFTLLNTLKKFAPKRTNILLFFYWLNPVLFYISYIHGQLDVAAMSLVILSLYFLTTEKLVLSSVVFALSALCKFHVMVIVPFVAAYIWARYFRKEALKNLSLWIGLAVTITTLGFLPHFFAEKIGYVTTTSPEAFRIFAATVSLTNGQVLYIGVALLLAVLGRLCFSSRISEEGLFFGSGLLFGTLLLITHSMPGWYYWVFPFVAVFFTNFLIAPQLLYGLSVLFYILNFALVPELTHSIPPLASDLLFTLLQTSIAGMLVSFWNLSLKTECPLSGRTHPLLIGVAGDSGCGKNTLSEVLSKLLDVKTTQVLDGDDYHKWERTNEKWSEYSHLNPKANHLDALWEHTSALLSGKLVFHPHYDHSTGVFTAPRSLAPKRNLIVQGLHSFYYVKMREHMRLRIFLNPDPLVQLAWKLKRDVTERGKDTSKVLEQIESRRHDAETHILPQMQLADWVIEVHAKNQITREEVIQGKTPQIYTRHVVWNDVPINSLAEELKRSGECMATIEVDPDNIDRLALKVDGEPKRETIEKIAKKIFPNLRWLTRGFSAPNWQAGYAGIEQLITLSLIQQRV